MEFTKHNDKNLNITSYNALVISSLWRNLNEECRVDLPAGETEFKFKIYF